MFLLDPGTLGKEGPLDLLASTVPKAFRVKEVNEEKRVPQVRRANLELVAGLVTKGRPELLD